MRKLAPLFVAVAVMLLAVGCGKEPPDAELAAAKAAVADAEAAGAGVNCPEKLKAAEDKLAEAEAEYAAEEYDEVRITAAEVIKLAEIAKACPPPPPPPPPPTPEPAMAPTVAPIYFDTDKYNIREGMQARAKDNAEKIKSGWTSKGNSVIIEGHCDERGSEEYNLALGDRRAKTVKNYLAAYGIDGKQIFTKSFGESQPVDMGHNEVAWAKNRRVEFKFKK